MLVKTRAFILHHINYSDSSIIIHAYTEQFGRQTYWMSGKGSKKKHSQFTMIQPLFLVEIEASQNPKSELQRVKQINLCNSYTSIPFNLGKSTIVLFLADFLSKSLREYEANPQLFNFLFHSILLLDTFDKNTGNFHLYFLISLSQHLGFFPVNNYSQINTYFDLKNGEFVDRIPAHPHFLLPELSFELQKILSSSFENFHLIQFPGKFRFELLKSIIQFYRLHMDGITEIKSLDILHEVFS